MAIGPPPVVPLYVTRDATFRQPFGFPGQADYIADIIGQFRVRRADRQSSPDLLVLTLEWQEPNPADELKVLWGYATATPGQTGALPSNRKLHYRVDLTDTTTGQTFRQVEGPLVVND